MKIEELQERLDQADEILKTIFGFNTTGHPLSPMPHHMWCNFPGDTKHCNCGASDCKEYVKKHYQEFYEERLNARSGLIKAMETGKVIERK